jgi:hypothetical protein
MHAIKHRVAVRSVETVEEPARIGLRVEGGHQVRSGIARPWGAYAASQRPSAFARATSAKPADFIRPSAVRRSARSRFSCDQALRAFRGVNLTL